MKFLTLAVLMIVPSICMAAEPIGWRGNGTGLYPQADPPTQWSQTSKAVDGLRFQAQAPAGDKPSGIPMPDGVIREWLILGPIPAAQEAADGVKSDDQSKLSPAAGAKIGAAEWKPLAIDTAFIDFAREFKTYDKTPDDVAYAHAYIYSPADASFIVSLQHTRAAQLWINGKLTHKPTETELNYTPQAVTLRQGWNRMLIRSTPSSANDRAEHRAVGIWYVNVVFRAAPSKAEFKQKNIKWKSSLPAPEGVGAPIVVGGKVFVLSEPSDLVCLDAATGKTLWVRSNNYAELATDAERKAQPDTFKEIDPLVAKLKTYNDSFASPTPPKLEDIGSRDAYKTKVDLEQKLLSLMKNIDDKKYSRPKGQDVGYAGFTPVSDGKYVWAWFATGVTCCYDLDGKLIWRRLDNEGSFFEHGYSVSPVLADGKLMVFMNKLLAFDALKGDLAWTTPLEGLALLRFHGTPALVKLGNATVCVLAPGHIVRMSDGKIIHSKGPDISARQQEIPSPVAIGNTVYELSTYGRFNKVVLPAQVADPLNPISVKGATLDVSRYPTTYIDWFMSSPLIHEGLAYCVNNAGVLVVVDVDTMQVVYQKLLDLDAFQTAHEEAGRGVGASPALAGGKIYIVGDAGATLVIKPGRKYEQLAKNKIESVIHRYYGERTEQFVASPVFEGKRIYLRGQRFLYCLGE